MEPDNEPSPALPAHHLGRHPGRDGGPPLRVLLRSSAALWACASGQAGAAQASASLADSATLTLAATSGTTAL